MGDHMQRIAREYDDLETKIQKQKKNSKGEAKVAEYTKLQEHKLQEWTKDAPEFLQVFRCISKSWMVTKLNAKKNVFLETPKSGRIRLGKLKDHHL